MFHRMNTDVHGSPTSATSSSDEANASFTSSSYAPSEGWKFEEEEVFCPIYCCVDYHELPKLMPETGNTACETDSWNSVEERL